jgi:hypothetical protein
LAKQPVPLEECGREVITALRQHKSFAEGELARNLLDALYEHRTGLDQKLLALSVYGTDADTTEEQSWSNTRALVGRVRSQFKQLGKASDFAGLKCWVSLLGKPYRLEFSPRQIETPRSPPPKATAFWKPYLVAEAAPLVVFSEPLFFYEDQRRTYVRATLVNDASEMENLGYFVRPSVMKGLQPVYHYLATGEVMAALAFFDVFQDAGKRVVFGKSSDYCTTEPFKNNDLIVIGSGRTSACIQEYQEDRRFLLPDYTNNVVVDSTKKRDYTDSVPAEGRMKLYAVLTRFITGRGRQVTVIAANNGRATEGVAHFVTAPDRLVNLEAALTRKAAGEFPDAFQVLFEVEIDTKRRERVVRKTRLLEVEV